MIKKLFDLGCAALALAVLAVSVPRPSAASAGEVRDLVRNAFGSGRSIGAGSSAPAEVSSVQLERAGSGVRLRVTASAGLLWAAGAGSGGELVIHLANAQPGAGVSDIEPGLSFVSAVKVESSREAPFPTTILTVQGREALAYSVSSGANQLLISLRASAAAPGSTVLTERPEDTAPETGSGVGPAAGSFEQMTIGPGDVLEIDVFGLPELRRKVRIFRDGTITLPLLGNLPIAGRTLWEAERQIATELAARQLVEDPQVSIFVQDFASRAVSVQGDVKKPGVYQLVGADSLLDVLGMAGGIAGREGAGGKIMILRDGPAGDQEKLEIDATRLIGEGDLSLNVRLRPGDVLIVPPAKTYRVYVTGAVRNPGPQEFPSSSGLTVFQAISAAGGPAERANLGNVYVLRRLAGGGHQKIKVRVKKIQRGEEPDFPLQENDTVVVKEWFF